MGLMGAASGLGVIFGPASASLFAMWGLNVPYFAASALGLVTTTVAFMWLKETRHHAQKQAAARKSEGMLQVLRSGLLAYFMLMFIAVVIMAILEATFGYLAMDRFGLSETPSAMPVLWTSLMLTATNIMGIAFTFYGISAVITQALVVGKMMEKIGEEKTIVIGLLLSSLGAAMVIFSSDLISIILSASILAVGAGLMMPSINTAVSKRTDEDNQGVVMGLLGSFNSVGRTLGPVTGGLLYSMAMILPYAVSATVSLLSAITFHVYVRRDSEDLKTVKINRAKS